MVTAVGEDDVGRQYYAALYRPGCLAVLPWGNAQFDCVIFLCDPIQAGDACEELSRELARANVDWIQAAGPGAEELHDAVDRTSVAVSRQRAVGDGSPMTSWHEEMVDPEQMAEVAALCFGGREHVLVLVVGRESDLVRSLEAVTNCLSRRRT